MEDILLSRDGERRTRRAAEREASISLSRSEFYAAECGTVAGARRGGCMCTRAPRERTISVVAPSVASVSPTSSLFLRPRPSPSRLLPSFQPSSRWVLSTFKLEFQPPQSSQLNGQEEICHRYGVHMFRFVLVPVLSISGPHPPPSYSTGHPEKLNAYLASSPKIRTVLSIRCLATIGIPHASRGRAVLPRECSVSRHTPSLSKPISAVV